MISWDAVQHALDQGITEGVFSGAAAGILAMNDSPHYFYAGKITDDAAAPRVDSATHFDLASLTKVVATTSIIARLKDRDEIDLSEKIWNGATVAETLCHQAGFAAWEKIESISDIKRMMPKYPVGTTTVYSDLGFMMLADFVEKKTANPFPRLFEEEVKRPMKCPSFVFNPIKTGIAKGKIAATEEVKERGGLIHGEVHDDNTYRLGGVGGHAGLFGTVADCLTHARIWLQSCEGESNYLSKKIALDFVKPRKAKDGTARALGWDIPSGLESSGGKKISRKAVGHLGFTGTSVWIDLERKAAIALLTNRVHRTSKNEKIKKFRPAFHDTVWGVLDS